MELNFHIHEEGPFFDGRMETAVEAFGYHWENVMADRAVNEVRRVLPTQYMYFGFNGGTPQFNPVPDDAGFLAASVHTERATEDYAFVTTDPVIYGPWIEGDAPGNQIVWPHRRNPPPRRFPGYHTFRVVTQQLNEEAEIIAEREIGPYIEEMN